MENPLDIDLADLAETLRKSSIRGGLTSNNTKDILVYLGGIATDTEICLTQSMCHYLALVVDAMAKQCHEKI